MSEEAHEERLAKLEDELAAVIAKLNASVAEHGGMHSQAHVVENNVTQLLRKSSETAEVVKDNQAGVRAVTDSIRQLHALVLRGHSDSAHHHAETLTSIGALSKRMDGHEKRLTRLENILPIRLWFWFTGAVIAVSSAVLTSYIWNILTLTRG